VGNQQLGIASSLLEVQGRSVNFHGIRKSESLSRSRQELANEAECAGGPKGPSKNMLCIRGEGFFRSDEARATSISAVIGEERAAKSERKRTAARRVALKLAWGFVAQSVEYRRGYTPSLAPRPRLI